jgi:hypothetical protein
MNTNVVFSSPTNTLFCTIKTQRSDHPPEQRRLRAFPLLLSDQPALWNDQEKITERSFTLCSFINHRQMNELIIC